MSTQSQQTPGAEPVEAFEARLLVASFVVVLAAWGLASVLHDPSPVVSSENRYRATLPEWSPGEPMSTFLGEFDEYLADRVRFRDGLITLYSRAWVGVFGVSPSPEVVVGRDGWFFFNDPVAVGQARGLARFEPAELVQWQRVLEGRRDWLAERGIPFVVVFVPNKHLVYSEFLPERFAVVDESAAEVEPHRQLVAHLEAHSDLVVVDLLPRLLEAKKRQRVFHKTDTHWNDVGAYLAYRSVLEAVVQVLPRYSEALQPVAVEASRFDGRGIGLTTMLGLSAYHGEEILKLSVAQPRSEVLWPKQAQYARFEREQRPLAHGVRAASGPRAVIFRDSFANALIPYLSENFSRVLYVWARDLVPRIVEREEPDVVIQQIAGRLLDREPVSVERMEAVPPPPAGNVRAMATPGR